MGESSDQGMLVRISSARSISICVRGRHQNGWEEHNLEPMWNTLMKHVDLEKPASF